MCLRLIATATHFRFVYRIVLSADGNHSLQKKTKKDDSDDISLGVGHGFFVDPTTMAAMVAASYARDEDTKPVSFLSFRDVRIDSRHVVGNLQWFQGYALPTSGEISIP